MVVPIVVGCHFGETTPILHPDFQEVVIDGRKIEGTRFAYLKRQEVNLSTVQIFSLYFNVFLNCSQFNPTMAPFINRYLGPKWFQREFPTQNQKYYEEKIGIWKAYLTPDILSIRFVISKNNLGLVRYCLNLVARQFGLSQF